MATCVTYYASPVCCNNGATAQLHAQYSANNNQVALFSQAGHQVAALPSTDKQAPLTSANSFTTSSSGCSDWAGAWDGSRGAAAAVAGGPFQLASAAATSALHSNDAVVPGATYSSDDSSLLDIADAFGSVFGPGAVAAASPFLDDLSSTASVNALYMQAPYHAKEPFCSAASAPAPLGGPLPVLQVAPLGNVRHAAAAPNGVAELAGAPLSLASFDFGPSSAASLGSDMALSVASAPGELGAAYNGHVKSASFGGGATRSLPFHVTPLDVSGAPSYSSTPSAWEPTNGSSATSKSPHHATVASPPAYNTTGPQPQQQLGMHLHQAPTQQQQQQQHQASHGVCASKSFSAPPPRQATAPVSPPDVSGGSWGDQHGAYSHSPKADTTMARPHHGAPSPQQQQQHSGMTVHVASPTPVTQEPGSVTRSLEGPNGSNGAMHTPFGPPQQVIHHPQPPALQDIVEPGGCYQQAPVNGGGMASPRPVAPPPRVKQEAAVIQRAPSVHTITSSMDPAAPAQTLDRGGSRQEEDPASAVPKIKPLGRADSICDRETNKRSRAAFDAPLITRIQFADGSFKEIPAERAAQLYRYRHKRMLRMKALTDGQKTVRYQCRKVLADGRPRINGRFAKVHTY